MQYEIDEKRRIEEGHSELVFFAKDIDAWHQVFSDVLGPAVKPAGQKPTKEDVRLTGDYGDIWTGQTLFMKDFEDVRVVAMFWLWEDGIHVTLKMVLLKKEKVEIKLGAYKARGRFAHLFA